MIKSQAKINLAWLLVERDGFEPSKQDATDLQSAPFSHSGISPNDIYYYNIAWTFCQHLCNKNYNLKYNLM